VIQGPRLTYGQGPNNTPDGFDSAEVVAQNIERFSGLAHDVVVSSWVGSELAHASKGVRLLESTPPRFDPDNRRKQFLSTAMGIRALSADVTHVLKVRTDQLIPPTLLPWLSRTLFEQGSRQIGRTDLGRIIISEFLPTTNFYVGDFVFAGRRHDVELFVETNVAFGAKNLHPMIAVDYVLKYLSRVEPSFEDALSPSVPYLLQIADPRNRRAVEAWSRWKYEYFAALPRDILLDFEWRGRAMASILDWGGFEFFGEGTRPPKVSPKGALASLPSLSRFAYQEYGRYWRKRSSGLSEIIKRGILHGDYRPPR